MLPLRRSYPLIAAFAFLSPFSLESQAAISLDTSSLPSTQGWTYVDLAAGFGVLPPESSVFSVAGGILTQNSIGFGQTGPGYTFPITSLDLGQPVTLAVRARVLQSEGTGSDYGLSFGIQTTSLAFGFGLAVDSGVFRIQDDNSQLLSTAIDVTQFHDYRMLANFNSGTYTLFADNAQIGSGSVFTSSGGLLDAVYFGDGTFSQNALGEVAVFSVNPVPEPVSVAFALAAASLFARRRRR